jgi:hypothetical protein
VARKIYHGSYTRQDYKDWGKEGGRPRKWTNDAERKKWARKQKALEEGRELRGYRMGRVRKMVGDYKNLEQKVDIVRCPNWKTLLRTPQAIYNTRVNYNWKEQEGIKPQLIPSCKNCGYEFAIRKTFHVALSDVQRKARSQEKKLEEEDDEEEEE